MKVISLFSLLFVIFSSNLAAANNENKEGAKLFIQHCASCHGVEGGMDMSKRVAPPGIAIRMHYIGTYPDKDSFVAAVADWVESPDENNSFMRGAIIRFNIMKAIKLKREESEKIAAYIYDGDIENPAGFQQHFEERHGKK